MRIAKTKRHLLLSVLTFGLLLSLAALWTNKDNLSSAADARQFRAGNIMSDFVMTNKSSMTEAQIQTFLLSKNSCNDRNISKAAAYPHLQYNIRDGKFVCLAEENFNGESAARIIWQAAQDYNINPQVLIVLLEKEQGLITDTWPNNIQYRAATGYGCPDTADCDGKYYGFKNQVRNAANFFRAYQTGNTGWYKLVWPGNKYTGAWQPFDYAVQLHPNAACGSINTRIENRATASLYSYTPYRPNQAALNAQYGHGDSCSSYGNRNFWMFFNDWFGSTQLTSYTPFFQLQGSVTTYVFGANKTYYTINNYERLQDYGFENRFNLKIQQLNPSDLNGYTHKGALPAVTRFEGMGVYMMSNGLRHPFPSEDVFTSYGYSFGAEANLPKEASSLIPEGAPLWKVVRNTDSSKSYAIELGKKRLICSNQAYASLGSPAYSSQPSSALPTDLIGSIPSSLPLAVDGDFLKSHNGKTYGIWERNSLIEVDESTARELSLTACTIPDDVARQISRSQERVSNLIKDSSGRQYILDGTRKLQVNSEGSVTLPLAPTTFTLVPKAFTDKLSTSPLKEVVRIDNEPNVYIIRGGKLYGVPSPTDLVGLGYNFSQVQSISRKTHSLLEYVGKIYRPGAIVREDGTLGVYILDDNFEKHPYTDEKQFFNYGWSWGDVSVIPRGSLGAYKSSTPAIQFVKEDDGNFWLIDRGIKHRVLGELSGPLHYNLTNTAIMTLPGSVLSRLPMSSPTTAVIRGEGDRGVYKIENGKKRVFASEDALLRHGYSWSDVRIHSPFVLNNIQTGDPIF